MSIYCNSLTNETRDFDDVWFAAAVAAGNPKVAEWALRPAAPSYTSTQHPPEWINGEWIVRDKTAEELAAEADAAQNLIERQQIKTTMAALKAGTGTAAERLARLERASFHLLKNLL